MPPYFQSPALRAESNNLTRKAVPGVYPNDTEFRAYREPPKESESQRMARQQAIRPIMGDIVLGLMGGKAVGSMLPKTGMGYARVGADVAKFTAADYAYDALKGDSDTFVNKVNSFFTPDDYDPNSPEAQQFRNQFFQGKTYLGKHIKDPDYLNYAGGAASMLSGKGGMRPWFFGTALNELGALMNVPKSRNMDKFKQPTNYDPTIPNI